VKRVYKVPFYDLTAPEARMFAGTDVVVLFSTEKDAVSVRMSRRHAEALRDSITQTLVLLDAVAAADGVSAPVREPAEETEEAES